MDELFTPVDLRRAVEWNQPKLEYRRLRARGTLWMVMAFDEARATTAALEDEYLPFVVGQRERHDEWFTLMKRFVAAEIAAAWTTVALTAELGGRKRNDTIIVEAGALHSIPVITRDGGVDAKAQRRGVPTTTPEGYAETVLPLDAARKRFFERFETRVLPHVVEAAYVRGGNLEDQCWWMRWARVMLMHIWSNDPPLPGWARSLAMRERTRR